MGKGGLEHARAHIAVRCVSRMIFWERRRLDQWGPCGIGTVPVGPDGGDRTPEIVLGLLVPGENRRVRQRHRQFGHDARFPVNAAGRRVSGEEPHCEVHEAALRGLICPEIGILRLLRCAFRAVEAAQAARYRDLLSIPRSAELGRRCCGHIARRGEQKWPNIVRRARRKEAWGRPPLPRHRRPRASGKRGPAEPARSPRLAFSATPSFENGKR